MSGTVYRSSPGIVSKFGTTRDFPERYWVVPSCPVYFMDFSQIFPRFSQPGPASADLFDDTMPPLLESMMDELDKAADKDLDERIFCEDIDKDLDPDLY